MAGSRLVLCVLGGLAGLFGAAGVGLAAAGAHLAGGAMVTTAANFLLFHAGALIGICALARGDGRRTLLAAGAIISIGTILFSGDLALRALAHVTLIHMAAPTGGVLMILGWLVAAAAMVLSLGRGRTDELP